MKKDESSVTSLISAFGRAYHSQYDEPKIFDDNLAKTLISQQEFRNIKMGHTNSALSDAARACRILRKRAAP